MAKLGEVCSINPRSYALEDDIEVSFIPMTKVGEHGEFDASEIKNYSEVKKGFTNFQNGDILFAKITPCMENGKGAIAHNMKNGIGFGSTEFHVLRPDTDKMTSEWLYYLTTWKTFRKEAESNMTGSAGQKRVPKTFLENYVVNLPDIDTQKSESKILRKVDDLIFLRKQQLAKLDELVKARFVEMFGDPIANPKQYKCYTVDDIIQFQGGSQPDKKFFEYEKTPDNIRLIQIRDYRTDKFATYIPTTMAKRFCTAEDIMIGRYGPPIFQILQGLEGSFNVALMKATPKRGNREFIRWFLKQDCLLHYLEGLSKRTAGQDGIQIDKLKAYPFPYPPDELQNEFATFVERVDQQKQTVQQSLEKLKLMKKALMQEYFG
jgi:type I restriction enzyme S subunit